MATYTTRLQTLIDGYAQGQIALSTAEKIEFARKKLFDFDYPFFDEGLRASFETNFIRKFYMNEIGFETEGLFKFQLETWLLINMPYFNRLLESETLVFNPFENVDVKINTTTDTNKDRKDVLDRTDTETMTEVETKNQDTVGNQTSHNETETTNSQSSTGTSDTDTTNQQTSTGTSETDATNQTLNDDFNRHLETETPDERLAITTNDGQGVIEYASKINEDTNNRKENRTSAESVDTTNNTNGSTTDTTNTTAETNGNTTGSIDTTMNSTVNIDESSNTNQNKTGEQNQNLDSVIKSLETYARTEKGKIGTMTYSDMLQGYRSTFLRVQNDIFTEMRQLFMLIY